MDNTTFIFREFCFEHLAGNVTILTTITAVTSSEAVNDAITLDSMEVSKHHIRGLLHGLPVSCVAEGYGGGWHRHHQGGFGAVCPVSHGGGDEIPDPVVRANFLKVPERAFTVRKVQRYRLQGTGSYGGICDGAGGEGGEDHGEHPR